MADVMRPVPFKELLKRIFSEFKQSRSIFDIPEEQFYRRNEDNSWLCFLIRVQVNNA